MGNIRTILNGLPTDDDSLCVNVIDDVGPGGNFLTQRDTVKRARKQSKAVLFDRQVRDRWLSDNPDERTVTERAYSAALKILETHKPLPLPEDISRSLSNLVAEYEDELKN
jgi:trimethylamine--corrinoid protein Co-methyltransferase